MRRTFGFFTLAILFAGTALAQPAGKAPAPAGRQPDQPTAAPAAPVTGAQPGQVRSGKYTLEQYETQLTEAVAEKLRQISAVRQQQIEKLQQLLKNPYYENKAEVYFRLAEAHWEEGLYQYLQKRKDYEKALDEFQAGRMSEQPPEPVEDYSTSLEYYRKVLREFPNYVRIDEVVYYLGKGALKEGKAKRDPPLQKEGADYLNRLVQDHPKSRFIAEAHLAMAEYYFENNSLYYAKTNYEKIINNHPKSSMFNYALYKLGWVYFNLHEFDQAIDTFKKVVAQVSKGQGKGVIEFRNQALNDLVVTYAEIDDGWIHARDYFVKVLPEDAAYKKLRSLGDLYVGQDKDLYAIALFRHFIEREKNSTNIPEYFKIILGIYKKTNDTPKLDEVTLETLEYFKPNGTWMTVNQATEDSVEAANALCEEHVLFLANLYHREAQRLTKADLYRKAADKYAIYLTRFAESKNAYIVNFYYAEILYDQIKDFKAAAEQYKRVIERDTKGEHVEDAALGAIYCYEEMMVAAGLQERSKKGSGIEVVKVDPKKLDAPIPETPLHELETEYVRAADKYVELLTALIKDPDVRKKNPQRGEKIPEIMYIAAQVFYRHGKFQDAVSRLKTLFDYDPASKFAAYAVFTLLDCYQRLKQWPKVEEWAKRLIAARNFTVKTEKELKKIVAIAITENASMLTESREYDQAIKEAMRVVDLAKAERDDETAAKALYNVAALYEGQKNVDLAVKTYQRVMKEYPKSEMAPTALYTIGLIYESQTLFDKAADSFEQMEQFKTTKEPTGDDKEKKEQYAKLQEQMANALQNAGLIREALGEYKEAIGTYQVFLKLFPANPETPKIDLRIGLAYEAMEKGDALRRAHDHYQAWLKRPYKAPDLAIEAYARAGAALKKVDKVANRKAVVVQFGKAIELFGKLGDNADAVKNAKQYAAQSAFELADYLYDDFNAINIPSTLDAARLKKALTDKAEAQQRAEKGFDAVLTYKSGGWSAGALFKIGLLYHEFWKQLYEVPVPECPCPLPNQRDCKPAQEAYKNGDFELKQWPWGSNWAMECMTFQDQYRAVLEEIGRPVETKSLKAFERALKLAHEEKVYNSWSKQCGQYAVKVNQDTFPVAGDDQVKASHQKDTLASTSFIRSLRRGNIEVKIVEVGK
ncbi:MAG: tetratricopeptide repeat protein [Deltaproteobacteria bacterium]|nr:tetratricopeptide repeat protein [Deltaproteobacteria bacterium]